MARSRWVTWVQRVTVAAVSGAALWCGGCGYHQFVGPLEPAPVAGGSVTTARDGSAVCVVGGGLTVRVRAMLDGELNQQFAEHSQAGVHSTNPYTFGDVEFWPPSHGRGRFAVFLVEVVNDGFPKVKVDPALMVLRGGHGNEYWSLNLAQLDSYYRAYTGGYEGEAFGRYRERLDVLTRTLYKNEEVYVDQEKQGLVVFPILDADVAEVVLHLHDVVLRFDYRNEPVEVVDLAFRFRRDVGRVYDDGRVILRERGE